MNKLRTMIRSLSVLMNEGKTEMAQNKSSKLLLRSERNLVRDILLLLSNTYNYISGKKNLNRKCLGISTHFASSSA